MCGIAGLLAWDNHYHVTPDMLHRMSACIAHRGPDDASTYLNHSSEPRVDHPQIGLAFRRLAILDLDPRANQPMTDHAGHWIILNGEIYNFRELRSELTTINPNYQWRTTGDTE